MGAVKCEKRSWGLCSRVIIRSPLTNSVPLVGLGSRCNSAHEDALNAVGIYPEYLSGLLFEACETASAVHSF